MSQAGDEIGAEGGVADGDRFVDGRGKMGGGHGLGITAFMGRH